MRMHFLSPKCFKNAKRIIPISETLLRIVTDWSDTEINGLKRSIGEDSAMQLLIGCKVHWIRSWHCVRGRVWKRLKKKQIFNKTATASIHCDAPSALKYFKVLCSQSSTKTLLNVIKVLSLEEVEFLDKNCNWIAAKKRVERWISPNT